MDIKEDFSKLFKLSDKVAKVCHLFAEENLQVQFESNASTACFNPASRVITFPYNMTMLNDDDIMILFLTHEVGHAFWSSTEFIVKANNLEVGSESNIVEDIRIERMIKNKYPGLVASYTRGYKKLYDQGFFGEIAQHKIMSFPNRLNIVAKCGHITANNITFNAKEIEFMNRCFAATTEQEVLDLAVELGKWDSDIISILKAMTKEELGEIVGPIQKEEVVEEETGDDEYSEDSDDVYQTPTTGGTTTAEELSDEDYEELIKKIAKHQEQLDVAFEMGKKIDVSNVVGATFINYESVPFEIDYFTADDYIKIINFNLNNDTSHLIKHTQTFISNLSRSVDYMAKEFEMKKAAARIKNSRISNTGRIDVNRVCQYKVTDKIFGNKMIFKDDKKHGMILLIDGSGSINSMFGNMIKQVLLLTEYAKKIGVPFKVFIFGADFRTHMLDRVNDRFSSSTYWKSPMMYNNFYKGFCSNSFFEVMNSEMSKMDYLIAASGLMRRVGFMLGGTPTGYAMHAIEQIAPKFFSTQNITNKKIFVLTDGGPTDVTSVTNRVAVVDKVTRKLYRTNEASHYTSISIIGRVFKDRYDIDVISLVVTNYRREVGQFIDCSSKKYFDVINDKKFSSNKFIRTTDALELPLFIIKPIASETDIELESVTSDSSVASAASAFTKAMKKMQISQTMLQALNDQFAV